MRSYSSAVSLAGFVRMESGTASFPMSWNMPPNLTASSSLGVKPSSSADGDRDPLHAAGVSGRVRILGLHRRVQRLDGLEGALLQALVGVREGARALPEHVGLTHHRLRRVPDEQDEREPEEGEDRGRRDPDHAAPVGDRRLERRGVGVDLVRAHDLAVGADRSVDLEELRDPERLGGVLLFGEVLEVAVGLAGLDRLRQAAAERVGVPDALGGETGPRERAVRVPDLHVDDVGTALEIGGDHRGSLLVDDDLAALDEVRADDRVRVLGEAALRVVDGLVAEGRR